MKHILAAQILGPAIFAVLGLAAPAVHADISYSYVTIDPFSSQYVQATGVNASGEVVGSYQDANYNTYGFETGANGGGSVTLIDPASTTQGVYPTGVNALGEAVGNYTDLSTYNTYGFVTGANGGASPTMIDPAASPYVQVTGINDSGQIAGYYINTSANNPAYGFLRPGPAEWAARPALTLPVLRMCRSPGSTPAAKPPGSTRTPAPTTIMAS